MMMTSTPRFDPAPTAGPSAGPGLTLFAMPVGAPVTGMPTPTAPQFHEHEEHHGRLYAAIALIAAALVLGGMGVVRYVQTLETSTTAAVTTTVPAQYAGVSLPQAMRLADQAAVTTTVPAQYAGVSLPQAMRLADQAAVTTTVPAQYAGVSLPQAMRLADQAAQ